MAKQLAFVFALGIAAFGAGWWVNGLYHDSLQLNIERAAKQAGDKARAEAQAISRESARQLENQLRISPMQRPGKSEPKLLNLCSLMCVSPEFAACTTAPPSVSSESYQENLLTKCPILLPRLNGQTGKHVSEPLELFLTL